MKKKINIENYEAYLLDLSEGKITDADRAELMIFLDEHPELDWDFSGLPTLESPTNQLSNSRLASLKKEESTGLSELDHLMVSAIEGVANAQERGKLNELISEEEGLKKEYQLFEKTILPKERLVFPDKEELLKKERKVLPLWTYVSSIAAAILAIVLFNLPADQSYSPRSSEFSVLTPPEEKAVFAFEVESELSIEDGNSKTAKKIKKEREPSPSQLNRMNSSDKIQLAKAEVEEDPKRADDQFAAAEEKPRRLELKNSDQDEAIADLKVNEPSLTKLEQTATIEKPANKSVKSAQKSLSPLEYANKLVKEEVLKNKTLSETLLDEVAELTNDKLKFEKKEKDSPQFALNLGKLRITKK